MEGTLWTGCVIVIYYSSYFSAYRCLPPAWPTHLPKAKCLAQRCHIFRPGSRKAFLTSLKTWLKRMKLANMSYSLCISTAALIVIKWRKKTSSRHPIRPSLKKILMSLRLISGVIVKWLWIKTPRWRKKSWRRNGILFIPLLSYF